MSREEAIAILNHNISACLHGTEWGEALDMAIQALEQEPCEDAISRQAVLEAIDVKAWEFCDYLISKNRNDEQKPVSHFADNLRECVREELPSVKPQEPQTDYKAFAEWVSKEIFDDNWEYNKESFAEIACRKLAKLGIVARMYDEWVLMERSE